MKKTAIALSAFAALAGCGQSETDIIADIDNSASSIFTSIADCVSDGNTESECEDSYQKAYRNSGAVKYQEHETCINIHQQCERRTVREQSHVIMVNKVVIPQYRNRDYSFAPIVAWQVTDENINKGVLLYRGATPNTAIRKDGRTFNLG